MLMSPPPKPPSHSELTLSELAEYHRQLVSYYQHALQLAAEQLYRVESILKTHNGSTTVKAVLESSSVSSLNQTSDSSNHNIYQRLTQILEVNKGKMLHVDYLIWELDEQGVLVGKGEVKRALTKGEKEGYWYAVPDSPDCWTIDLNDFPDLSARKSQPGKKTTKHKSIKDNKTQRLPYSEKVEMFVTLTTAIQECLQLHYPEMMNATAIMQWLYPNKLSASQKETVRTSINTALSKGCDTQGWKRVKTGYYLWDM
jgi:hypothetical protein